MTKAKNHYSPLTNAFIHRYQPIRVFFYDHRPFPRNAINPSDLRVMRLRDRKIVAST